MIGPAVFLTNPMVQDTDDDGVMDGGYKVGTPPSLAPACPDLDGDGTCDAVAAARCR